VQFQVKGRGTNLKISEEARKERGVGKKKEGKLRLSRSNSKVAPQRKAKDERKYAGETTRTSVMKGVRGGDPSGNVNDVGKEWAMARVNTTAAPL